MLPVHPLKQHIAAFSKRIHSGSRIIRLPKVQCYDERRLMRVHEWRGADGYLWNKTRRTTTGNGLYYCYFKSENFTCALQVRSSSRMTFFVFFFSLGCVNDEWIHHQQQGCRMVLARRPSLSWEVNTNTIPPLRQLAQSQGSGTSLCTGRWYSVCPRRTVTVRTMPYWSGCVWVILASSHDIGGRFSFLMTTSCPGIRFCCNTCHLLRGCRVARYSLLQRDQISLT